MAELPCAGPRRNGIFGRRASLTRIFFHQSQGSRRMTRPIGDRHSASTPQTRHLPAAFWALLALTLVVRLVGITRPLLGNFATKNCVYAMIARNWAEGRAGLLYPTLDVLRGGHRSLHLLRFPCSAYLTGGLWKVFGGSLDVWGRATAVAFSVASVALMFLLCVAVMGGRPPRPRPSRWPSRRRASSTARASCSRPRWCSSQWPPFSAWPDRLARHGPHGGCSRWGSRPPRCG